MRIDAGIGTNLARVAGEARRLEAIGYDGIKVAELNHDPFLPLAIAAEHTERAELVTNVAIAFARNPMSMAHMAHDLNAYSGGRFVLGIGTQVRPHIVDRFGMPWYKAVRQAREFIEAMHAIFDCWYEGEPLDFEGEYYHHTLMPKTFTPENTEAGRPRIILSATGPLMTKAAAEVADGLIMHPFSTERYIRDVSLPAIERGLEASGRARDEFEIDYAPMMVCGRNDEELAAAAAQIRDRIAFYGSTPAYSAVLEHHGWGELQKELNFLYKQHRTAEMAALIDDDILETFAIIGDPESVVAELGRRFGGLIDRTGFSAPALGDQELADVLRELK